MVLGKEGAHFKCAFATFFCGLVHSSVFSWGGTTTITTSTRVTQLLL